MDKIYKKFFKEYIWGQKKFFILVCVVTIFQSMITMCIPLTTKELLDHAFPDKNRILFLKMVAVMMLCYVLVLFLNVTKDYLLAKISEGLSFRLREELNSKISLMQYSYFDHHSLSEILSKYNKEIDAIKENCGYMLVKSLSNIATFILACIMIISMEWRIMIVSVILMIFYVLNNKYWGKKVKNLFEKSMRCNEDAIHSVTENYKNVLITKLYSAYDFVNKKFADIYVKQYKTNMNLEVVYSININSSGFFTYLLAACIWLIGGSGILSGFLTIGTVTALINYQGMLLSPMSFFSEFNNSYQGTVVAMKRLYNILKYEEENGDGFDVYGDKINHIQFKNVYFQYSDDTKVLDNINIDLKKGEVAAFIGGSGCGKSSLVKMLLRLYSPKEGDIYVNDQRIQDISVRCLRDKISFVAQDSFFYSGSILENLGMGRTPDADSLIKYSRLLDLYDEIMNLPYRWETELNSETSNLSGGQKKRLDVLRALLKDSEVIIFDESTASIDIERRKRLFELVNKMKQDKIIIFITHNTEECAYFDKIYAVKNRNVYPVGFHNLAEAY